MYYISLIFNACAVWVINNEDSHIVPWTENRRLYCKQGFFFFFKGVCVGRGWIVQIWMSTVQKQDVKYRNKHMYAQVFRKYTVSFIWYTHNIWTKVTLVNMLLVNLHPHPVYMSMYPYSVDKGPNLMPFGSDCLKGTAKPGRKWHRSTEFCSHAKSPAGVQNMSLLHHFDWFT